MALDPRDPRIQEFIREQEEHPAEEKPKKKATKKEPEAESSAEAAKTKKQRRPFKKKRAGIVLSRDEVKAIKKGRRKLRKELRQRGIRGKRDFELTASTLGLYFDKRSTLLPWLLKHWLGALLAALALLLAVLFLFSLVSQMRGHFTVSMSRGMFREGFTLSETVKFDQPTTQLFAQSAENVPCISINQLPRNIDMIDGQHNEAYFAYTYYIRNEGESTVGYRWELDLSSQSAGASDAVWVAMFEDGKMRIYAKADWKTGKPAALPALNDDSRGYSILPIRELAPDSDQFQEICTKNSVTYWRVIPDKFESDLQVASGEQTGVHPGESHKYTIVLWIEGDDPEATDDIIGGHLGVEMNYQMIAEVNEDGNSLRVRWREFWKSIWNDMVFWEK